MKTLSPALRRVFAALLFIAPPTSHADKVAVVVGVSDYRGNMPNLPSAATDARAVAKLLKSSGFSFPLATESSTGVTLNPTRNGLNSILEDTGSFRHAEVVFYYFAGHGGQVGEKIYVLGSDARVPKADRGDTKSEEAESSGLRRHGIAVSEFAISLQPDDGMGLAMILDACRSGSKAGKRGPTMSDNCILICSTECMQVAQNGKDGGSSPFTRTLVQQLRNGKSLLQSMSSTADRLEQQTKQRPAVYCLNPISRIAGFTLHQEADPSPSSPSSQVTPATPNYTEALYLTSNVRTGVSLRISPGGRSVGEVYQHGDYTPVGLTNASKRSRQSGASYLPYQQSGWVMSRNTRTGREFLTRSGGQWKVVNSKIKMRHEPQQAERGILELEPGAVVALSGNSTLNDGYEWRKATWRGWVTETTKTGKAYTSAKSTGAAPVGRRDEPPASLSRAVRLTGSFQFRGTGNYHYPSIRTLQFEVVNGTVKGPVTMDFEDTFPQRSYSGKVTLTGKLKGREFASDSQSVIANDYGSWTHEAARIEFNQDFSSAAATFSFWSKQRNEKVSATGTFR